MKAPLPPVYFLGGLVLQVGFHLLLPAHQIVASPWRLLGVVPLVAGIALNLIADHAFKGHQTTVKPFQQSNALVTGGVFRISRNPMYLGMVLILLGVALLLDSAAPFVVAFVLAFLLDRIFIAEEEQMLKATFAERYSEYCRHVRRWL